MKKKKTFKQLREEIANAVGPGNVAGLGVGPQGEPPVKKNPFLLFRRKSPKTAS